jgi:hypothetical protein
MYLFIIQVEQYIIYLNIRRYTYFIFKRAILFLNKNQLLKNQLIL